MQSLILYLIYLQKCIAGTGDEFQMLLDGSGFYAPIHTDVLKQHFQRYY